MVNNIYSVQTNTNDSDCVRIKCIKFIKDNDIILVGNANAKSGDNGNIKNLNNGLLMFEDQTQAQTFETFYNKVRQNEYIEGGILPTIFDLVNSNIDINPEQFVEIPRDMSMNIFVSFPLNAELYNCWRILEDLNGRIFYVKGETTKYFYCENKTDMPLVSSLMNSYSPTDWPFDSNLKLDAISGGSFTTNGSETYFITDTVDNTVKYRHSGDIVSKTMVNLNGLKRSLKQWMKEKK